MNLNFSLHIIILSLIMIACEAEQSNPTPAGFMSIIRDTGITLEEEDSEETDSVRMGSQMDQGEEVVGGLEGSEINQGEDEVTETREMESDQGGDEITETREMEIDQGEDEITETREMEIDQGEDEMGEIAGVEMGDLDISAGSTEMANETPGGMVVVGGSDMSTIPDSESHGDSESATVLCGNQSCDLTTDTCCLREFGASCVAGAEVRCDLGGTALICDGPEDCNGEQCCLGVGIPGSIECSPNDCLNLTLCHIDQECAEDQVCRYCQFTGIALAVCSRPNVIPNLALSCD